MSKSAGIKRKLHEATNESADPQGWLQIHGDLLNVDIEDVVSNTVEDIRSGKHFEVTRRCAALDRLREKQVAACDRHRKEQIKNINQLFEYEVEEAKSQFERACNELKEQLVAEVIDECSKLRSLQKKLQDQAQRNTDTKIASSASRALRSTQADITQVESKTRPRRRAKEPQIQLNKTIPESNRRADFLEIVRDLQAQAKAWEEHSSKSAKTVAVSEDNSSLSIDGKSIFLGDQVEITSHLSGETFNGMLSLISQNEIIVRTGSGVRISFQIMQLRTNRVTLALASR